MTITPTPFDAAVALLQDGRLVEAEALMVREVQAVTARHGAGTPEWASVQCDLGNVLINADQVPRAIDCYRAAVSVSPRDFPELHKDHLTYVSNLGGALRLAGRLDEAEAELRRGAEERAAFYGRDHAGFGFGLEPLAELLLDRGDLAGARAVAEEMVANLDAARHPRVVVAMALRAEIVRAQGPAEPAFAGAERLPAELIEDLAGAVLARSGAGRPLLTELVALLEARLGPDHRATLATLSRIANLGRDSGDQTGRIEAIQRVLASHDRQGQAEAALQVALGLALAHGDAGDQEAGLRAYSSAYERATRLGRPELVSQVLRNWGLALRDADRPADAERALADAVRAAETGADYELLGRGRIALGLFLQHQNRLAEARGVIEQGLAVLDPVHPDAMIGRSHLGAVLEGRTCGCGDMPDTIARAYREFVLSKVPRGLLADVHVEVTGGDFRVNVELSREPQQAELERLNEVMQSAYAEFRRRLVAS
ncbi:hypothetical protein ACQP00_25725 [Dactylosporangium sp. CS-047395]|uniref:hypothetical protein n=1 Tax=Dactylosporangium sp. CS-047395 TaxID=3239936 RepID=UPI003D917A16